MGPLQIFLAVLCTMWATQQVTGVVNNGQSAKAEDSKSTSKGPFINKSSTINDVDPVAAGRKGMVGGSSLQVGSKYGGMPPELLSFLPSSVSDRPAPNEPIKNLVFPERHMDSAPPGSKGNRREASVPPELSYLPTGPSSNLPVPVYGVPNTPSSNIIYPELPPDIPPQVHLPSSFSLQLANTYGIPNENYLVPPPESYGSPVVRVKRPPPPRFRPQHGPPAKPFHSKYAQKYPPKSTGYKQFKPFSNFKGNTNKLKSNFNVLPHSYGQSSFTSQSNKLNSAIATQYGVPNTIIPTYPDMHRGGYGNEVPGKQTNGQSNSIHYGFSRPTHVGPPHPGVAAPPTPPDIKYDGWQPISGLLYRVPTSNYGVPATNEQKTGDIDLLSLGNFGEYQQTSSSSSYASLGTHALQHSLVAPNRQVSDSYSAPLNTVTGSGGVVTASADDIYRNRNSGANGGQNIHDTKNYVNEIYPSGAASVAGHSENTELASGGYYGAGHSATSTFESANLQGSHNSFGSHEYNGLYAPNPGLGLIPPSMIYGIPPNGREYGTQLYSDESFDGQPTNSVSGLFDSITQQSSYKYADGQFAHSTYTTPPIAVPHQNNAYRPTDLYSLPYENSPITFQTIDQGLLSGFNFNSDESYNAPLGSTGGFYSLPETHSGLSQDVTDLSQDIVGLDTSHPGFTIDLTPGYSSQSTLSVTNDCSSKPQALPSLSYGVPSANSYTASLATQTTNIGGSDGGVAKTASYGVPDLPTSIPKLGYTISNPKPHETYGVPDLNVAHSQKFTTKLQANISETESAGKSYGYSVAKSFGPSSELIQSHSIDFNNIPLQGALGSYTLQIQSANDGQNQIPHGQIMKDGLLESILAAIEQPRKGENSYGQPIIQFQKSLEQQNFVTNDTISSVVEQLTDTEIRLAELSRQTAEKVLETSDSESEYSTPNRYVVAAPSNEQNHDEVEYPQAEEEDENVPLEEENAIALYFSNKHRTKKGTDKETDIENKSDDEKKSNDDEKQ